MTAPEVTPAVRRGAAELNMIDLSDIRDDKPYAARQVLKHALDRQEIAQALYEQHRADVEWQTGAMPSTWADAEQTTRDAYLELADVVIGAALGEGPDVVWQGDGVRAVASDLVAVDDEGESDV